MGKGYDGLLGPEPGLQLGSQTAQIGRGKTLLMVCKMSVTGLLRNQEYVLISIVMAKREIYIRLIAQEHTGSGKDDNVE